MNTIKKLLCVFLTMILISGVAVGCGTTGNGNGSTGAASDHPAQTSANANLTGAMTDENGNPVDSQGYILDSIPDSVKYTGEEIQILYWQDVENPEYFSEYEGEGSEIDSAIFRRNLKVEQRLGVSLVYIPTSGNSANAANFLAFVKGALSGGEKFDIISAHSRSVGLCAYNGLTVDLSKAGGLDFEKPWWQDSLLTTATVNGQLHFVSGDISTNMLYMMYVVYFNKLQLSSHPDLTLPYDDVDNGAWTIDRMIGMSEGFYSNLDGIPGKTAGDQYAQSAKELHLDALLWGSDILGFRNEGGKLMLDTNFTGQKCSDLIDKLYNYFYNTDDAILCDDSKEYKDIFADGRSLFIIDRADIAISDLNDKQFDMGILPVPKYDADQESYRTIIGNPFSLYAIPVFAQDPERSAYVLECLASESYRQVTPVIFEITMKTRYSDESRDAKMYDYARDGAVYDLSRVFWKVISSEGGKAPDTLFEEALSTGGSGWTKTIKATQRVLNNIISSIDKKFSAE